MEKIKRLVFLSAILIALVMSSCCKEKYKKYIPADSKVLGKIDVKAFFEQTGADKDKLLEDIDDAFGEDADFDFSSIKDMGLNVDYPMYIFGRGKGTNYTFGIVAKVDDKDNVKKWFENNSKKVEFKKDDDGFEYYANDKQEGAIGLNGDALVIIITPGNEAKGEIKKIMRKNYEGDIDENELFKKVNESKSFACLYADLSIVPEDLIKMAQREAPDGVRDYIKYIRKMTVGFEGSFDDGVCDFALSIESDDSKAQEKIDEVKDMLRTITEKGMETIPDDAIGGLAANLDGSKIVDFTKSILDKLNLKDKDDSEFKYMLASLFDIVGDIDGDLVAYSFAPSRSRETPDMMLAVETKSNTSDKIVELIRDFESMSNRNEDYYSYQDSLSSYSYAPTQYGYSDSQPSAYDDGYESDYDSGYGSSYGSSSLPIEETADGYCINNGHGSRVWFGTKNGALYFTNSESMISSAFKKADDPVSGLVSFATSRRFLLFLNLEIIMDFTSEMSRGDKQAVKAFDEILSKINYVTFSMK